MCVIAYFMLLDIGLHNTHKNTILAFDYNHILHNVPRIFLSGIILPSNCLLLSYKVLCGAELEGDP